MARILLTIVYFIIYLLIHTILLPISIVLAYLGNLEYVFVRTLNLKSYKYIISKTSNFVEKILVSLRDFYTFIVFRKKAFNKWDYNIALWNFIDNVKYYYKKYFKNKWVI